MRMRQWLLIDEGNGVAFIGSTAELENKLHIRGQNLCRSVANNSHLCALGYYFFEVIKLDYKYNFYDEEGKLVAEEKNHDDDPEIDETGFDSKEIKKMLQGKFIDGLTADEVLVPDIYVAIPQKLYTHHKLGVLELVKDEGWRVKR